MSFIAEIILRWAQEPINPTEVEGKNITLRWDFNLTGDTVDQVEWTDEKNGKSIARLSSGVIKIFTAYKERFKVIASEKATLMIFNLTRTDTGGYKCIVETDEGEEFSSVIQLNVLCK